MQIRDMWCTVLNIPSPRPLEYVVERDAARLLEGQFILQYWPKVIHAKQRTSHVARDARFQQKVDFSRHRLDVALRMLTKTAQLFLQTVERR
jgi:hypothetical protein